MTKTPGTKGKEILKHYNEVKVTVSHPMGQFMIHLCSHELGLSSNWSGWSGSSELVLGVVITSWGVVSLSINGYYAVESFAELRDSWKEEFKKACGTKVNGYKQVGSRGHIWDLVGDTVLSKLKKGTENEGGTKRLEMIKYNPLKSQSLDSLKSQSLDSSRYRAMDLDLNIKRDYQKECWLKYV